MEHKPLTMTLICCYFQFGHALRCPAAKFITHTLSHATFLILLAAATFRLDDKVYPVTNSENINITMDTSDTQSSEETIDSLLKGTFRPANTLMTDVQICLMFWILGK